MKNEINQKGYTFLWALVIVLFVIIIAAFFVFRVGEGRWECEEYSQEICKAVCMEGKITTSTVIGCHNTTNITCNGFGYMDYVQPECLREVWTRKV